jgi:hypothetical protein
MMACTGVAHRGRASRGRWLPALLTIILSVETAATVQAGHIASTRFDVAGCSSCHAPKKGGVSDNDAVDGTSRITTSTRSITLVPSTWSTPGDSGCIAPDNTDAHPPPRGRHPALAHTRRLITLRQLVSQAPRRRDFHRPAKFRWVPLPILLRHGLGQFRKREGLPRLPRAGTGRRGRAHHQARGPASRTPSHPQPQHPGRQPVAGNFSSSIPDSSAGTNDSLCRLLSGAAGRSTHSVAALLIKHAANACITLANLIAINDVPPLQSRTSGYIIFMERVPS